jgi:hypothetical protein
MKQFARERRRFVAGIAVVVLLALTALGFGVSQAVANSTVKVPILHDDSCGDSTSHDQVGTAQFVYEKSVLSVRVQMRGADPGDYHLLVYSNDVGCNQIADLGKFKVDTTGNGSKAGHASLPGFHTFFVVMRNSTTGNDSNSLEVKLG